MSRQFLLDLAARGHRVPLGVDLVLREQDDPEGVLLDGHRLGGVIEQAARRFRTPLAFPIMDLRLEKLSLVRRMGVRDAEAESFHFAVTPSRAQRERFFRQLKTAAPVSRVAAVLGALQHLAQTPGLFPIGMCIGPFSLTTKLVADPITPAFLAGAGASAEEEPEVELLESCLELSLGYVLRYVELQIAAGARAVFIAEPAANQTYFSPKQMARGGEAFERFVLEPNQRIADLLADRGAELILHCCGEMSDAMLEGLCTLRPSMLSLGSSRRFWEDAKRVPKDVVLYGNLPSRLFYSDQTMPRERVAELAAGLAERMAATGHPFILGTECDTLSVAGAEAIIRGKVMRMLEPA